MANVLTQNPIRIDSAMATSWKTQIAAAYGTFQDLRVEKIYWENPVTVGDTVNIEDNLANTLVNLKCNIALTPQTLDWVSKPKRWADFTVNQISSGVLWIYLV